MSPSALTGDEPVDVVVTLGTDHHPFARLVAWVDAWAGAHPDRTCVVQHGTAPPPTHAEGHAVLDPAVIPGLMARARVVVGHAGPGTVLDARAAGRLPVVVPRLAAQGEVVDDHQVTFGRWMAARGQALCVEDEDALHRHLDAAVADPGAYAVERADGAPPAAVTLLGDLIDGVLAR
ncbi:glycosyltransferase [Iamia majanohamensis]|uniref:Glycosyltransferase n=1 Tax=Iamia majanohamensis TaxID=467976 RepID=A0AAF0BX33_9ACTN|nr:glycosyltransferase [Iamia majanohamensis]WCO68560.1 glycosyltransferase [Iamia majanohamensis]